MKNGQKNSIPVASNEEAERLGKRAALLWLIAVGTAVAGSLVLLKGLNACETQGTLLTVYTLTAAQMFLLAIIVGVIAFRQNKKAKSMETGKEEKK